MKLGYPRHGLRVTVRLNGTVVGQRVLWSPPVSALLTMAALTGVAALVMDLLGDSGVTLLGFWTPLMSELAILLLAPTGVVLALTALLWRRRVHLGVDGDDAVPTPGGLPLASITWAPGELPSFVDHTAADRVIEMGPDARWRWAMDKVEVEVAAQDHQSARRMPTDPLGDVGLVVVALALYVGVMQAQLFGELMPQPAAPGSGNDVSPELIARLLEKDLDGADEGLTERAQRPDHERKTGDSYLPAGAPGPMTRVGGGPVEGPAVVRAPPSEEQALDPPQREPQDDGEDALAMDSAPLPQDMESPAVAPAPVLAEQLEPEQRLASQPASAMERFVGWGFRDWFDASVARQEIDPQVERQLNMARRRLKIDPDDFGSLQTVGLYAYLAENVELSVSAYQRLIDLYPEESVGYNNLGLIYKRQGKWNKEEALYRKALELDPSDPVVLENLALNLAHQGRFAEALGIMDLLSDLDPEDPYSDLHRAKIYAAMGRREKAYHYLDRALDHVDEIDTLHQIEFRQDLRLEPLLATMRKEPRFQRMLRQAYGPDAEELLRGEGGSHG